MKLAFGGFKVLLWQFVLEPADNNFAPVQNFCILYLIIDYNSENSLQILILSFYVRALFCGDFMENCDEFSL